MLRDDINMLDRAVAQYAPGDLMCGAWLRIKTALVVLGAATNTGRYEMPPACGNCLIGVNKCSAVYGQQSCHATLWLHFTRT